jgi:hypothetical protein
MPADAEKALGQGLHLLHVRRELHPFEGFERRRDAALHVGEGEADGPGAEVYPEEPRARGETSMKPASSSSLAITRESPAWRRLLL